MSLKTVGMFLGLFLLVGVFAVSFVSAGEVILKTVPAQKVWIADGVTQYRMDVYADNTAMIGEYTKSIDWRVVAPQELSGHLTMIAASWPASNDFFSGYSDSGSNLGWWNPAYKSVWGTGPSNRQGRVASYWFTVSPSAPTGQKSFDLGDTTVYDSNNHDQQYIVQNVPFRVTNLKKHTAILDSSSSAQESCPIGQTC